MRTKTEQMIRHKRTQSGILVPLLEDMFHSAVEIDSDEDVDFLTDLLTRMKTRQDARTNKPLYSPSQLASCLRYVYLLKHHRELEIPYNRVTSTSANFIFFNGNFVHVKWQFALWKLERFIDDPEVFVLHGVEIPIVSKRKDHGGTVDALCSIRGEPFIVDFKGLNVRTFGEISRGFVPPQYASQISNYGMLYNSSKRNGRPKISKGLLLSESKGGPTQRHLIALHETEIPIKTYLPEVRQRLEVLREHGEENSIPPPECTSTGSVQFTGCPFRKFCRDEIKQIEKRVRKSQRKNAERLTLAFPEKSGRNRTRGNSKRRRQRTT